MGFLGHLLADAGQIYLMLLVVMFAVFLLQTYIDTDRMQRKLAGLKNIWGYLLAFGLGVISPFCSCSIVPVLMGLIAVGVPMSVCLCMLTTASLLNLTAVKIFNIGCGTTQRLHQSRFTSGCQLS